MITPARAGSWLVNELMAFTLALADFRLFRFRAETLSAGRLRPGPMRNIWRWSSCFLASLTIRGTETRNTANQITSVGYVVRNQEGYTLSDAGSDVWNDDPTLGQPLPVILNVCAGTPPATRLTITITDWYNQDGALILKNVPVPTR